MRLDMPMSVDKTFAGDIKIFEKMLAEKEQFTFSKYADGEWAVMKQQTLNNNEFVFKNNIEDEQRRLELIQSFQYRHPQYYVGISCPCCQGQQTFDEMKQFSGQDYKRLTWANLWVNSNYQYYRDNIIPHFSNYNVALFAHENSTLHNLPFQPKIFVSVQKNAWINSYHKIDKITKIMNQEDMKGWLFLFCCGPFGNILAHRLTQHNPYNTYLDIGSTLNPYLKTEGFRRGYFSKHQQMKPCVWG